MKDWISVEVQLPRYYQHVLIYFVGGLSDKKLMKVDHMIKNYNGQKEWRHTSSDAIITHWMPLPEPPKV